MWGEEEEIIGLLEITTELRWSLEIPRRVPASHQLEELASGICYEINERPYAFSDMQRHAGVQGSMREGIRIHASASCAPDGRRAQKDSRCATGWVLWRWASAHWHLALCTPSAQALEALRPEEALRERRGYPRRDPFGVRRRATITVGNTGMTFF
ncbi:hypothetical protein B0H17DRAFT_1134016 [Mycena rosella]|uniref:Uncharacterized protein n=1 Tax=Mycena rosella TaxID=1033263 RepID=A0AAD7DJF8_MYCRO|nr:hypothetical protein B0H17DRAFT_1134016 [Mycena rosella]